MSTLKVKKLFTDAKIPNKPKTQTDSGFDCYAHNIKKIFIHHDSDAEIELNETKGFNQRVETDSSIGDTKTTITLHSQERALIGTGIAATIGDGYEIQVRSRSGYALKNGLMVLNSPGTVN